MSVRNENGKKLKKGSSRLIQLALTKKTLIISAVILSSLASIASFVPFIAIYWIIKIVLASYPDVGGLDLHHVMFYGGLAFGGTVLNILLYFLALACSHLAAFGTLYELKLDFASHIAKVPLGFHLVVGSGRLRKILDENIEKIEEFIAHQVPDIAAALVAPAVMILILLAVDWRFGMAVMLGIILAFFLQARMYGNEGAKGIMRQYQSALEEMNNASVEYVRGISVVKAFGQTVYSFRRLHDTIKSYTAMVMSYTFAWENSMSAYSALINNMYLFVVPVGIWVGMRTADYPVYASTFIFYLLFVPASAAVLLKTMYVVSNGIRILGGVEGMDALLMRAPLPQPEHPKEIDFFDVELKNVSFAYDKDKEINAVSDVSFEARQGEITAIVGPSGGGKSTLAHLVPRFFDVTAGAIRIGGTDIRDMNSDYLMQQVSFVFQDVFLFKQSVMDNIRLGNLGASDEQVIEAAKAAQCHDFIAHLPKGYHTVIGTKGVHLSGGERQRLAIARAIVKDAPIVVLDEATAFADPENEYLIQKAFETLMKNKTVIMIAHRLSTVQGANKIIVVSDGRVVEQGTHSQLLELKGKYFDMWNVYTQTMSWNMVREEE